MSIRIVVADDLHVNRKARVYKLQTESNYEVVAEAANGERAMFAVKAHHPDILLLDLNMPVMDGFEVLETLQKEKDEVKTIVVSMNDYRKHIIRCFELGARGFLSLHHETDEELTAISSVMENGFYFNGQTSISLIKEIMRLKKFEPRFDVDIVHFSEEEMQVLNAFARGLTNAETATKIYISESKVERIKKGMEEKIKVEHFISVLIYAHQKGLIDLDRIPLKAA